MQLKAASMAILCVGATLALLNMAFHPLARMGRGSGSLGDGAAVAQQAAVLRQPDAVLDSVAAATGAAVAALGAADAAAAQQGKDTASEAETQQQAEETEQGSTDEAKAAGIQRAADLYGGTGAAEAVGGADMVPYVAEAPNAVEGRHPLQQRVCGSPAVDGYAHVMPQCLVDSPSAKWWSDWEASGGNPDDLVMHIERHADFDGLAVGWGIGNKKASVEECGEACRAHRRNPQGENYEPLPCNAFAWCSEEECFEPDAHKHSLGDCWLKFTEGPASPEVNMRGELDAAARQRHPTAPVVVQWHAGVLLPADVGFRNGTWSPRHDWR